MKRNYVQPELVIEDVEQEQMVATSDDILIDIDSDAIGIPEEADCPMLDWQTDWIDLEFVTNDNLKK